MATEGLTLEFADSGVQRLAEVAFEVNERTENIGARRLHTVMERLLETVSFDAADRSGTRVVINREYVEGNLGELVKDQDLVAVHSVSALQVGAAHRYQGAYRIASARRALR